MNGRANRSGRSHDTSARGRGGGVAHDRSRGADPSRLTRLRSTLGNRGLGQLMAARGDRCETINRLVACEEPENCPARAPGETTRSRTSPHDVGVLPGSVFGVLISNFAVDESQAKSGLPGDQIWIELVAHLGTGAADTWEIVGFADCPGGESTNSGLRDARAAVVAALLPTAVASRIRTVGGAPQGDCIDSNASEGNRSRNRSVLVRRLPGSTGPTPPSGPTLIGPVIPPGAPGAFCDPFTGMTAALQAAIARAYVERVWLPYTSSMFGSDVHDLWRDYLGRPKGSSLAPRVFSGAGNRIVDAFAADPETVRHQVLVYREIAAAASRTPEASVPLAGSSYTSPAIPLADLLPATSLIRTINYTDPATRIPGNIAGGTGVLGVGSSDAGPDLRLFTGTVAIRRVRPAAGGPEMRSALITLQLQVIDAVDFCPGAPGGTAAQAITIPMSRLEATPTEPTYDLPFHVIVDLSGTEPIP
jgi:outer membrane protein OmpA-like peptidoglycan-associated protein